MAHESPGINASPDRALSVGLRQPWRFYFGVGVGFQRSANEPSVGGVTATLAVGLVAMVVALPARALCRGPVGSGSGMI